MGQVRVQVQQVPADCRRQVQRFLHYKQWERSEVKVEERGIVRRVGLDYIQSGQGDIDYAQGKYELVQGK